MYSIEEIKENYKNFSDSKIENIAKFESKGLRKEILPILIAEIERRNLKINLIDKVDSETNSFRGKERELLIESIVKIDCPKCGNDLDRLYGFEINIISGFILFTSKTRNEKLLCRSCGNKAKAQAIFITLLTGWWSRGGILSTPFRLVTDISNFFYINKLSNKILERIVDDHSGFFRRQGTEKKPIRRLIKTRNKMHIEHQDTFM